MRIFIEERQGTQRFWHVNQIFSCFCEIISGNISGDWCKKLHKAVLGCIRLY